MASHDKMKVGNEHIKPTYKSKKPLTDALFKIYEKNLWKIKLTETTGPYDALTIAYNTLMHLHCQLGDYEAAIEVFETIQNMEINEKLINADTFNVVLELFSNQESLTKILISPSRLGSPMQLSKHSPSFNIGKSEEHE